MTRRWATGAVVMIGLACLACSSADNSAVQGIERSHAIILPRYLDYVDKDSKLSAKEKDDQRKLVESLQDLVADLKKSMGER